MRSLRKGFAVRISSMRRVEMRACTRDSMPIILMDLRAESIFLVAARRVWTTWSHFCCSRLEEREMAAERSMQTVVSLVRVWEEKG